MKIKEAVEQYLEYQKSNMKPQAFKNHKNLIKDLQGDFEDREIKEITSADVFAFLTPRTEGLKQSTKHQKYVFLKSFFNFCMRAGDIDGRKLTLVAPKSGKDFEEAYMPESLATKLTSYIRENDLKPEDRIFPLSYSGGRRVVVLAGDRVGKKVRPHDLRRHSATYASRSGMPLEVISKMILRHQSLLTTQRYLGKITDAEALHWVDRVHGV
jgi:site-specific recombinase XerD